MVDPKVAVGDHGAGLDELILGAKDRSDGATNGGSHRRRVGSSAVVPVGSESMNPLPRPTNSSPPDFGAAASAASSSSRYEGVCPDVRGSRRPMFSQEPWSSFAGSLSPKQGADQSKVRSTFLGPLTSPPVARIGSESLIPQVGSIEHTFMQLWSSCGGVAASMPPAGWSGRRSVK